MGPVQASAAIPNDSYIAGYAAGVLKRDFKLDLPSLVVQNGVITRSDGRFSGKRQGTSIEGISRNSGCYRGKAAGTHQPANFGCFFSSG